MVFCSEECCDGFARDRAAQRKARRARRRGRLLFGLYAAGACLIAHPGLVAPRAHRMAPAVAAAATGTALPPGWFGPVWPPTELNLLAELGQDSWIHPLAGPFRRMPVTDS